MGSLTALTESLKTSLENQGLLPKTQVSNKANPLDSLKKLYADPKYQALPADKQQAVRSHVYDKYVEPYYRKTKPGLNDQQFQQIRTRFVNPSQAQPLSANNKGISEKLHDWDVERDLALGKAGIRVMRGATDTGTGAARLLFWGSKEFEAKGMSPENAKIQGKIGDWIDRVHTRLGQAYDEQEDLVNKSLGNEYNKTLTQKIVNFPVSVAGGATEFFAKNPEYLAPEFSGGLLGKAGLSEKLLQGSLKEKWLYRGIKGAADGFLVGTAEGKKPEDVAATSVLWSELELGTPPVLGAAGKVAAKAADPAIKFLSNLLVKGGSSRVNTAVEAMATTSSEVIAKSDPTKVTSSVVKAMAKVGDQVAQAAGFTDHVDMIAKGKGRELVKGVNALVQQANKEAAVHNPELVQIQVNKDVKEVMGNPLGAELGSALAKMGFDPVKTATESVAENTKIAAGDLADVKTKVTKDIASHIDVFSGLGPGAASSKKKDVLGNLISLVETNIPMQSKTQTLTFMWGILDQLPQEARGPLAQKMKEVYGYDTKNWDAAARRLDDHLDKMIATGHITPNDKRGVFHSTKLLGDPTKWQEQLDAEYEAIKAKQGKLGTSHQVGTEEGAKRDTEIMARLAKEHPEWSLSQRLQEAAKEANPPKKVDLGQPSQEIAAYDRTDKNQYLDVIQNNREIVKSLEERMHSAYKRFTDTYGLYIREQDPKKKELFLKASDKAWDENTKLVRTYATYKVRLDEITRVASIRKLADGSTVLYASKSAMNKLHFASNPFASILSNTLGLNMPKENIPLLVSRLKGMDKPEITKPLIDALHKAKEVTSGPSITIIGTGRGVRETIDTAREELLHKAQSMLAGEGSIETHVSSESMATLRNSVPQKLETYLRKNNYRDNYGEFVIEASAKLMAGKGELMGVTDEEAADFLHKYFTAITEKHGVDALNQIQHTHGVARKIRSSMLEGATHEE